MLLFLKLALQRFTKKREFVSEHVYYGIKRGKCLFRFVTGM